MNRIFTLTVLSLKAGGWYSIGQYTTWISSASQSCYAWLNWHILYQLMNDRCFIHRGKIVCVLWSTFQVLWRGQGGGRRFERNEDWLNPTFQPFLPSDGEAILTLCWRSSLVSKQTHTQQITSWPVSWKPPQLNLLYINHTKLRGRWLGIHSTV